MVNESAGSLGRARGSAGAWAALLATGVAAVLIAQFLLDGWADGNEAAHWAQHALLFWGGLTTGAAVLRLYQLGSRPA